MKIIKAERQKKRATRQHDPSLGEIPWRDWLNHPSSAAIERPSAPVVGDQRGSEAILAMADSLVMVLALLLLAG